MRAVLIALALCGCAAPAKHFPFPTNPTAADYAAGIRRALPAEIPTVEQLDREAHQWAR